MNVDVDYRNKGIQVISRAASILRVLSMEPGGMSLGQIAGKTQLPRSTVQRIVGALMAEGLVSNNSGHGGIKLGPAIQSLANSTASNTKDRLRPIMREVAAQTGETVDLAILDGKNMLFIDQVVGSQRLRAVSSIGERFPLTTTANGKAALACLRPSEAARLVLAEFEAIGESGAEIHAILAEIDTIRQGQLATDEDEHTEGISALGFAARDATGDIYALSLPVPSARYARQKEALSDAFVRARDEVSRMV